MAPHTKANAKITEPTNELSMLSTNPTVLLPNVPGPTDPVPAMFAQYMNPLPFSPPTKQPMYNTAQPTSHVPTQEPSGESGAPNPMQVTMLQSSLLSTQQLTNPPSSLRQSTQKQEPTPETTRAALTVEAFGQTYDLYTTDINLSGRGLTGTIPTELALLTELDSLWLFGNFLTGPIPSELAFADSTNFSQCSQKLPYWTHSHAAGAADFLD